MVVSMHSSNDNHVGRVGHHSLLWSVKRDGFDSCSYLYGTVHVADRRAFRLRPNVMPAFRCCRVFATEVLPNGMTSLSILLNARMEGGHTLQGLLAPDVYERLRTELQYRLGINIEAVKHVKPYVISGMLADSEYRQDQSESLDMHFLGLARAQGMKVVGLETLEEQTAAANVLSYHEQTDMLLERLNVLHRETQVADDLLEYYQRGDLDSLFTLNKSHYKMPDKLYEAVIVGRNQCMAERITALVSEHSSFVCLGAFHLPGEQGIIQLLSQRGYHLCPV